jgi:hypothetical protein
MYSVGTHVSMPLWSGLSMAHDLLLRHPTSTKPSNEPPP